MHHRALLVLCCAALLAACGSDRPKTEPPAQPAPAKVVKKTEPLGPLPAYQRELSGTLLEIPAGADVELALLVIDERGRPQQLLASSRLSGNGAALPFSLRFSPISIPPGQRLELRGRVSQAGILTLRLPARPIQPGSNQALGSLQLVPAP